MISAQRFQHALSTCSDQRQFQHVPVDWWDAPSQVWRPSVLEGGLDDGIGARTHAEIVAPLRNRDESPAITYVPKRVLICDLRPSRLVSERLAQFFTTRYTLEMLDSLMPCIDRASAEEQAQLRRVLSDLADVYSDTYAAWLAAFSTGVRDDPGLPHDGVWLDRTVDERWLPPTAGRSVLLTPPVPLDVFSAIEAEKRRGEINCSPVALWDEKEHVWRPTMMLGATGDDSQFRAGAAVPILVPGDPVIVVKVPGSLLQPLDIADTCFSLFAIPVLVRDFIRMHDGLLAADFSRGDVVSHPFMIAFARMLRGAADEWRALFDGGMTGDAPEPRVEPLPPTAWGFTADDVGAVTGENEGSG